MITNPYPLMHRRMKIGQMPVAARPILDRYKQEILLKGSFDANQFMQELCSVCRCTNHRAMMEMISVLWHATRDAALVYYFEHTEDRRPEYDYYLQCAYGAKRNRVHRPIAELKDMYWTAFHAARNFEIIVAN